MRELKPIKMTFWGKKKKKLAVFVLLYNSLPYKFPVASEALKTRLLFLAGFWNSFSSKTVTVLLRLLQASLLHLVCSIGTRDFINERTC